MAIIFQSNISKQIRICLQKSYLLKEYFDASADISVLRGHFQVLDDAFQNLKKMLPSELSMSESWGRHMSWLRKLLNESRAESCYQDICDICSFDINNFEDTYIQYVSKNFTHEKIATNVIKLLQEGNADSAVRKTGVILTEFLRTKFDVPNNQDGKDLVNTIFGSNGKIANHIPQAQRESYRDLLSGFYGLFRNDFMHNNRDADMFEAEAIVGFVNLVISKIDALPNI